MSCIQAVFEFLNRSRQKLTLNSRTRKDVRSQFVRGSASLSPFFLVGVRFNRLSFKVETLHRTDLFFHFHWLRIGFNSPLAIRITLHRIDRPQLPIFCPVYYHRTVLHHKFWLAATSGFTKLLKRPWLQVYTKLLLLALTHCETGHGDTRDGGLRCSPKCAMLVD